MKTIAKTTTRLKKVLGVLLDAISGSAGIAYSIGHGSFGSHKPSQGQRKKAASAAKTIRKTVAFVLFAGLTGVVSCQKEEPTSPPETRRPKPTITAKPLSFVDNRPGSTMIYELTIEAPSFIDKVHAIAFPAGHMVDSVFMGNIDHAVYTFSYTVPQNAPVGSDIVLKFLVIDQAGQVSEDKICAVRVRNVVCSGGPNVLGTHARDAGQNLFYDAWANKGFALDQAHQVQESIDMVSVYHENKHWIAAPANSIFGDGPEKASQLGVHHWTVRRPTTFRKTSLTACGFEETECAGMQEAYESAVGEEVGIVELQPGIWGNCGNEGIGVPPVIAFKTAEGKYGLLRMTSVGGSISFVSKVQQ